MQEAQDSLFVRRLPSATCGNIWASGYPAASVGGKVTVLRALHQLLLLGLHQFICRRTLATVPLLESSIKHCTVIRDRKFEVNQVAMHCFLLLAPRY